MNGVDRVFSRTASGNVPALRVLSGAATGFNGLRGVDVDLARDRIAVMRTIPDPALLFFPATATGNVGPVRTITGALTLLNGPNFHSYFSLARLRRRLRLRHRRRLGPGPAVRKSR
ncbi:MAG: hypothetical protein R2862_10840 [Thermoanaerobaculia bacterium]